MKKGFLKEKAIRLIGLGISTFLAAILLINVDIMAAGKVSLGDFEVDFDKNGEELVSKEEYYGDTSENEYNWYKFTMLKDGKFELKIKSDCEAVNIFVLDKNGNEVENEKVRITKGYEDEFSAPGHCYIRTDSGKVAAKLTFELKKEIYYVEINPGWFDTDMGGEYTLEAKYDGGKAESGKKTGSKLVWHFIETESQVEDDASYGDYSDYYDLDGEWYYHFAEYSHGKKQEEAVFDMRWDAPPAVIYPGEEVTLKVKMDVEGETETAFADTLSIGSGPFEDMDSYVNDIGFEDENQVSCIFVGSSLNAPYPNEAFFELYGSMPSDGRKGDKAAICVSTNGASMYYIYELTKYKDSMKNETVGIQLEDEEYFDFDVENEYLCECSDSKVLDDAAYTEIIYYCEDCNIVLPAGKSVAQMVINEIYARHGYMFTTKAIQEYFEGKSWYVPSTNDMNAISKMLNKTEQKNITFLKGKDK